MSGTCSMHVFEMNSKFWVRKTWGERPLGRTRRRSEDDIQMNRKRRWQYVDWIHLAQNGRQWRTFAEMVLNFSVPQKTGNILKI